MRCTTTPNVPAGATSAAGSSNDQRASNCPSKQQQTTIVVVVTAQQDQPSDDEDDVMNTHASSAAVATSSSTAAVTMHAQAYYLKTIQISIFAVAWTAVWTNYNLKLIITLTVIINTFVINTFIGLLLIFVNSGYQLFKFNKHIRAGNKKFIKTKQTSNSQTNNNIKRNVLVSPTYYYELLILHTKKKKKFYENIKILNEYYCVIIMKSEFYLNNHIKSCKSKKFINFCDGDYNYLSGEKIINNNKIIIMKRLNHLNHLQQHLKHKTKKIINYNSHYDSYYYYEKHINNICSFTFTKKCS